MKKLSLLFLSFVFIYLFMHINTNSVAGTPESEASFIQLGFFNIKYINETSLLSWNTTMTTDGSSFIIERSPDGKNYTELGRVKPIGVNNFNYVDYHPVHGINFYRFKRVDEDGKLTISPVRMIITDKESPYSLKPIMVKSIMTISNSNTSLHDTSIKIIAAKSGELTYEAVMASDKPEMDINLSNLPVGNYVAQMEIDGKVYNHTFVKQ